MKTARTSRTLEKGDWKPIFLAELARTGIVGVACTKAKIGRSTVYDVRKEDEAFAAAWDAALDDAVDTMESEAWRRGVKGTQKPVFQGGKEVGRIREYSDTLLIFMLKGARPEKYRDRQETRHTFEPINWDHVPPEVRDAFIEGKLKLDDVQRLLRTTGA